jgi:hypothetical protein
MTSFNYPLPAMTDPDIGDTPKISIVIDSTGETTGFIKFTATSITI